MRLSGQHCGTLPRPGYENLPCSAKGTAGTASLRERITEIANRFDQLRLPLQLRSGRITAGTDRPSKVGSGNFQLAEKSRQITSTARMMVFSIVASFFVLVSTLVLQWLVYDDWLHRTGPLHLVGSATAAMLTFLFIYRWQSGIREQHLEMLRRFQTIAEMNDRIRNALQIIACTTYASNPDATEHVRQAVTVIDHALEGVVADVRQGAGVAKKKSAAASTPQDSLPRSS